MNSMRTIVTHTPEFSGMALGGIGAGTVEIFPGGRLENWNGQVGVPFPRAG